MVIHLTYFKLVFIYIFYSNRINSNTFIYYKFNGIFFCALSHSLTVNLCYNASACDTVIKIYCPYITKFCLIIFRIDTDTVICVITCEISRRSLLWKAICKYTGLFFFSNSYIRSIEKNNVNINNRITCKVYI